MHAHSSSGRRWSYAVGFAVSLFGGLMLGIVFSVVALVVYVIQGPMAFTSMGVTLGSAVALYMCGFIVAGLMAGALNPLARRWWGAVIVGMIAMVPVSWGATSLLTGELWPLDRDSQFAVVMYSSLFGGGCGFLFWRELHSLAEPPK